MTTETKWTPGPWTTEVNEKAAAIRILGRHGDAGRNRISDGLGEIVDVDCSAADNEDAVFAPMLEEQIANAHLIAAAPDLYEALAAAVKIITTHLYGDREKVIDAISLLEDARAKARGEPT